MGENDITQIRIKNSLVGIVGIQFVIEAMARDYAACSDEEVGEEMARDLYALPLVREFRKYLGQPIAELPFEGMRVVILGPGCAQCDRMEIDVREVMADMQLAAELDHVTDVREIGRYGVMGLPALIINDKVVCVGQTPNRNKIREWLQAAQG
jgi:small redox-active disulfide protein 2